MEKMNLEARSTPSIFQFNPRIIPYQFNVVKDIATYDYRNGVLEILLSGSVGSAKSLVSAHAIVKHCMLNPHARAIIGRRALPDIKKTMFQTIVEHLECGELS